MNTASVRTKIYTGSFRADGTTPKMLRSQLGSPGRPVLDLARVPLSDGASLALAEAMELGEEAADLHSGIVQPARRRWDLRGFLRERCTRSCWRRSCIRCGACCVVFTALLSIVFGIMAATAVVSPTFTSVGVLASPTPMAHRGSIGLWPESTLFTFANTLALHPASVLEFDLRMTRDGHAVLLHDTSTSRTCNGGGQIHELTLNEARALDAGWWWGTAERNARGRDQKKDVDWATYPFRGLGLQIPTFAEVLSTFPNASKLVDLKDQPGASPGVPDALIRAACDAIMAPGVSPPQHERVIVASFHEDALVRFRKVCPGVATGQGIMGTAGLWASSLLGAEHAYTPSGSTVQGPRFFSLGPLRNVEVMTTRLLDAARNRNLHSSAARRHRCRRAEADAPAAGAWHRRPDHRPYRSGARRDGAQPVR